LEVYVLVSAYQYQA